MFLFGRKYKSSDAAWWVSSNLYLLHKKHLHMDAARIVQANESQQTS